MAPQLLLSSGTWDGAEFSARFWQQFCPFAVPNVQLAAPSMGIPVPSTRLPVLAGPQGQLQPPVHHPAASRQPEGHIHPTHTRFVPIDTEYISAEELAKVDKMLSHLSEESKQAAATTLVSPPSPVPILGSSPGCPRTRGFCCHR